MLGRNFIAEGDPNFSRLASFLRWPGGHMVVLLPFGGLFMLYVAFFETQAATMLISNESQHWQNFPEWRRPRFCYLTGPSKMCRA